MAEQKKRPRLTVNAAFLQEIKEVNESLWKLLDHVRCTCQSVPELLANRKEIAPQLALLRDELAMHFALEEAYGYFEDPVSVAPHLDRLAEQLRNEHVQLYTQVIQLVENVEAEQFRGNIAQAAPQIVQRFADFDQQLRRHEAREDDLIQTAFSDDIGVGD